MKILRRAFRKIPRKAKEYLLTVIIFLFILCVSAIPDYIYYHTDLWMSGTLFGKFCVYFRERGFSYTGALKTLNSNFGILVTAISVIITMSVNNLNRSENKFFGLTRAQFNFSKRRLVYQYGRRMILFAPLAMVIAVISKYCIAGYAILILSYLFLITAYFLFESSFSKEQDLNCIARKLLESAPQTIENLEDITDYLMLLNIMHQWNAKEKYWEGVNYLFRRVCNQTKEYDSREMYFICCCFYQAMYIQDIQNDCDKAVYALKDYITHKDREGWEQNDYLVLWGMMHCLIKECKKDSIVRFIRWYMDFPTRSRNIVGEHIQGHEMKFRCPIDMQDTRKQTGILLVEMELYLHDHKKVDNYIWEKLPQIWNEGKCLLDEREKIFRQQYLDINAIYELEMNSLEERLENLCSDYRYNTTKSLLVNYLKYKWQEEPDGDGM